MSLSSIVPPSPPQPGGGGGGGGSGGKTVGPSGPVDVGEMRLAGSSEMGEQQMPLTVPELVPWNAEYPPPPLPVEDNTSPVISLTDKEQIRLVSGSESGEVFDCWGRDGAVPCPTSAIRTLLSLG